MRSVQEAVAEPETAAAETATPWSAEPTVAALEARLGDLLDTADDGIVSIDAGQRIVGFNRAAERIFGYAADEVMGEPLDLLLPPGAGAAHRLAVARFADSADHHRRMGTRTEIRGRRRDGGEFPAEASISKLTIDGVTLFTAVVRDVSDRKRAQAMLLELNRELADRNRLLDLALQNMRRGFMLFGADGLLRLWNAHCAEMLGVLAGALRRGLSVRQVLALVPDPDAAAQLVSAWTRGASGAGGRMPSGGSFTLDGRRIECACSGVAGEWAIVTFTDVTDQQARETALRVGRDAATRVTDALRRPVDRLAALAEALLAGAPDAPPAAARARLAEIGEAARQLRAAIERL